MTAWRMRLAQWRARDVGEAVVPAAGGARCSYLAIIMDGNGRWARCRHLPVAAGHRAGARALRRVLEHAIKRGVREVTVFSFSTENWNRPQDEVDALMGLFVEMIETQVPDMHEREVRVRFVGSRQGIPEHLAHRIDEAERLTARNAAMTVFIAFNYGGRQEILDAATALAASGEAPTQDGFRRRLYAPDMHDPELLIRTSGELRLSNFLLWQCAYTELYFTDELWPDFDEAALDAALDEYQRRQRRFGGRAAGGTT